jgi:Druantia protein DruA
MRGSPRELRRFSGRTFSPQELEWIKGLLCSESLSRQQLSRRVCQQLNWSNRAGRLKEMSCRVALLRMERAGLIDLPAPLHPNTNGRTSPKEWAIPKPEGPLLATVGQLESIRLEVVQSEQGARWYRAMMRQHHYLGAKPMAGAQLRYLIWSGNWLLGGLGFGAAAWMMAARDRWIGWSASQRERWLEWVVNNSRFLLLPWVQGRNLASWILGRVAGQLPQDWQHRYGYRPVLIESFVEEERFAGTCYQAANWLGLGQTKGRGKLEKGHSPIVPIKRIFVRPLRSDFRDLLCS